MTNHNYQKIIDDLSWSISAGQNHFSLTFVRCNYPKVRQEIMQAIHIICEEEISELILNQNAINLDNEIEKFTKNKEIKSLVILSLEAVIKIDDLLTSANLQRERFRSDCPFPIVIWINNVTPLLKTFRNYSHSN